MVHPILVKQMGDHCPISMSVVHPVKILKGTGRDATGVARKPGNGAIVSAWQLGKGQRSSVAHKRLGWMLLQQKEAGARPVWYGRRGVRRSAAGSDRRRDVTKRQTIIHYMEKREALVRNSDKPAALSSRMGLRTKKKEEAKTALATHLAYMKMATLDTFV
jgi:hypothetical protein